jgi:hypothetical protein
MIKKLDKFRIRIQNDSWYETHAATRRIIHVNNIFNEVYEPTWNIPLDVTRNVTRNTTIDALKLEMNKL